MLLLLVVVMGLVVVVVVCVGMCGCCVCGSGGGSTSGTGPQRAAELHDPLLMLLLQAHRGRGQEMVSMVKTLTRTPVLRKKAVGPAVAVVVAVATITPTYIASLTNVVNRRGTL